MEFEITKDKILPDGCTVGERVVILTVIFDCAPVW